jgi:diguanylate cyclase (GGDEF)-like protein
VPGASLRSHPPRGSRPDPVAGLPALRGPRVALDLRAAAGGGQVIGSVLVVHDDALDNEEEARIRNSVAQAAPLLGNLRNLALAEFRANNDSLTGLPNKRATDDTLKRMVAQANRSITPLAAAMLDLDHFKQINDRFGHAKGDEVLAAVGATLRSCLRESDFAGRFGGEELLVLFPDTTAGDVVPLAERIRSAVESIRVPGVERTITVSIGLADLIQHGGDASGLLRQADRALYTAKGLGRNRVVVANADGHGRPEVHDGAGAADGTAAFGRSAMDGRRSCPGAPRRWVRTPASSHGRHRAAVDRELAARDVGAGRRGQEQDHRCQLVGRADPTQRDLELVDHRGEHGLRVGAGLGGRAGQPLVEPVGADHAGVDDVDAHAVRSAFGGQSLGVRRERGLRGRVGE